MNFNLSDEQKQLADAVRRFIDKDYGFESRKKNYESAAGYGDAAWGSLVEPARRDDSRRQMRVGAYRVERLLDGGGIRFEVGQHHRAGATLDHNVAERSM